MSDHFFTGQIILNSLSNTFLVQSIAPKVDRRDHESVGNHSSSILDDVAVKSAHYQVEQVVVELVSLYAPPTSLQDLQFSLISILKKKSLLRTIIE